MVPDEIETVTEEKLSLQRSEQSFVDKAEEFMRHLVEAGFPVHSVIENGFLYMTGDVFSADWGYKRLMAAQNFWEAARKLHIDGESQIRALPMGSQEIKQ